MNDKLLKKRWNEIDKKLSIFLNKYKRLNKDLQDELQDIFNGIDYTFENANKPISNEKRDRLTRLYQKWLNSGVLTSYASYRVRRVLNRKNITNYQMLLLITEVLYLKQDKELDEMSLLKDIVKITYEQGSKEALQEPKRLSWITSIYLASLLSLPNKVTGRIWGEYKASDIQYNAQQIVQQIMINLQQKRTLNVKNPEFQVLLASQQKRYLNKKKGIDKFSGSLDTEISYLVNSVLLQSYLDGGIEKVRFIAVLDEVTSNMCTSLNNQVFFIGKENRFIRYSASEKRDVMYKIVGLESGINLPPINDSFHYCRSSIYPERGN